MKKITRVFRKIRRNTRGAKLFLLLMAFTLFGFFMGVNQNKFRSLENIKAISRNQVVSVKNLLQLSKKKDFTLINVHTPYEGEVVNTDTFIPYNELVANSASLPEDKNTPIILYCKSGRMSEEGVATLIKLGYTNVKHLEGGMDAWKKAGNQVLDLSKIDTEVLPAQGYDIPIPWGDLGPQLVSLGVIDLDKFKSTVNPTPEQIDILTQSSNQNIKINLQNSQFVVDVLWALGLAQKSLAFTEGPMGSEYKKDTPNLSSTAGWSLARGDAMTHLGQHEIIPLSDAQQQQVKLIAQNVFRPCCGNSTWFPDCNHGMAALALIELMVAKNIPETEIYKYVLQFNSFWFTQNYLTLATYFARQGISWNQVDAKLALSETYSSGVGASEISKKVGPLPNQPKGGGGCGA